MFFNKFCNSFGQKQLKDIINNRKPFLQNKNILVHRTKIKEKKIVVPSSTESLTQQTYQSSSVLDMSQEREDSMP